MHAKIKKKRGGGADTKGYFYLSGIALTSGSAASPLARLLRVASAPTEGPPGAEALPPNPPGTVCPLACLSAAIGPWGVCVSPHPERRKVRPEGWRPF